MKKLTVLIVAFIFLLSINASAQWSEQASGVTTTLYSVSAVDNNVVWICGAGGKVLRSINGGTNWNLTVSPNAALDLYNILGVDANTAFVTGSNTTAYVYKTVNAGANWTLVFSQVGGFMNTITKVGSNNTYAICGDPVGGRWSLFVTENSGSTWDSSSLYIPQAGSETGYNNSAFTIGNGNNEGFYFGTNNTRIYKGINGQNWTAQPTGTQTDILTIAFYDTLNGAAGSTTGGLYTSNGGQVWGNNPTYIGSGSINGLAFTHEGVYYTRGSSVYFSANGYNYTAYTQTGTYTHLTKTNSISSNNIWAIRNNGGISKFTSSVGIIPISTQVPSSFSVSQNYPNPFNPSTTIKFDIVKTEKIKLIIFDALGRIVETLVNEQLQPGSYSVDWNAAQYPSGVYFYRLTAVNFTETKRMTLVK